MSEITMESIRQAAALIVIGVGIGVPMYETIKYFWGEGKKETTAKKTSPQEQPQPENNEHTAPALRLVEKKPSSKQKPSKQTPEEPRQATIALQGRLLKKTFT